MTTDRRQAGRATGSIVLLLVLLSGLGGWNYHRNLEIERQTEGVRPYKSYAVSDLESLRQAYAAELEGVRAEFASAKRKRTRPSRDIGSIAGNVQQFAQTSATSRSIRDAAAGVAEREGQLSELDRELDLRARFGQGLMRHVKRLTTI